ncbi:MAG: hypothetical protein JEY99_02105 [Spirochaetales bacterium]|nr:hypothetical protein [Spirochaetales bacterium]
MKRFFGGVISLVLLSYAGVVYSNPVHYPLPSVCTASAGILAGMGSPLSDRFGLSFNAGGILSFPTLPPNILPAPGITAEGSVDYVFNDRSTSSLKVGIFLENQIFLNPIVYEDKIILWDYLYFLKPGIYLALKFKSEKMFPWEISLKAGWIHYLCINQYNGIQNMPSFDAGVRFYILNL